MKTLTTHINEALKIGKDISKFSTYSCQPKSKDELKAIIDHRISKYGNGCNLNDIDVSQITDMSWLFFDTNFDGDISEWDTSNVTNMRNMFANLYFTGDISNWDTSNVKDMFRMFYGSAFNHDISNWNIRRDCNTEMMFNGCDIRNEFKPKGIV